MHPILAPRPRDSRTRVLARSCVVACLLVAAACARETVQPVEGLSNAQLTSIAHEAYPLWDPAGIQLVSMELRSGRPVGADRYELAIRYTVRKLKPDEPVAIDAWVARRRARLEPVIQAGGPEVAAAAARQEATTVESVKRVAAIGLGGTATFDDTLVLVRRSGQWTPQAWADNALLQDAVRARASAVQ